MSVPRTTQTFPQARTKLVQFCPRLCVVRRRKAGARSFMTVEVDTATARQYGITVTESTRCVVVKGYCTGAV